MQELPKTQDTPAPKRRRLRREPAVPGQLLLSKAQVIALVGVSYTKIWEWMREGLFPCSVELGPPGQRTTIAWHSREIHEWIEQRPRRKFGQHEHVEKDAEKPDAEEVKPAKRRAAAGAGAVRP